MNLDTRKALSDWLDANCSSENIKSEADLADLAQFGIAWDKSNEKLKLGEDREVRLLLLTPTEVKEEIEKRSLADIRAGSWRGVDCLNLAEALGELAGVGEAMKIYVGHHRKTRFWAAVQALNGELIDQAGKPVQ